MRKTKNAPTPEQVKEFEGYLKEYQTLLNLRDWRIEHGVRPASKGTMAEVEIQPEHRLATWYLGQDWGACPVNKKTLRGTALHECLHILLKQLIDACVSRDALAIAAQEHSIIALLCTVIEEAENDKA
jgi:hypothetical protein